MAGTTGIQYIMPHLTSKRVARIPRADLITLLEHPGVCTKTDTLSEVAQAAAAAVPDGSAIFTLLQPDDIAAAAEGAGSSSSAGTGTHHLVAIATWKSAHSINVMVKKEETASLLQVLQCSTGQAMIVPGLAEAYAAEAAKAEEAAKKEAEAQEKTEATADVVA